MANSVLHAIIDRKQKRIDGLRTMLEDVKEWIKTGEVFGIKYDEKSVLKAIDYVLREVKNEKI